MECRPLPQLQGEHKGALSDEKTGRRTALAYLGFVGWGRWLSLDSHSDLEFPSPVWGGGENGVYWLGRNPRGSTNQGL